MDYMDYRDKTSSICLHATRVMQEQALQDTGGSADVIEGRMPCMSQKLCSTLLSFVGLRAQVQGILEREPLFCATGAHLFSGCSARFLKVMRRRGDKTRSWSRCKSIRCARREH